MFWKSSITVPIAQAYLDPSTESASILKWAAEPLVGSGKNLTYLFVGVAHFQGLEQNKQTINNDRIINVP